MTINLTSLGVWVKTPQGLFTSIGVLVAIIVLLFGNAILIRFLLFLWGLLKPAGKIEKISNIEEKLFFIPKDGQSFWANGSDQEGPKIQMELVGNLTNEISSKNIKIQKAILEITGGVGRVGLLYRGDLNGPRWIPADSYNINGTQEIHISFWEKPGFEKEKKSIKSDVSLVDQHGDKHRLKDLEFKYRG